MYSGHKETKKPYKLLFEKFWNEGAYSEFVKKMKLELKELTRPAAELEGGKLPSLFFLDKKVVFNVERLLF